MPTPPPSAVYQLLGYPGTGKYTVARALVDRLEVGGATARLIDNHLVANPVLSLVPAGEDGLMPTAVWARVRAVRAEVMATIEQFTPAAWSLVLTNYWVDVERTAADLAEVVALAERRGSAFVPVLLTCDPDEILRRVVRSDRAARHKLIDPAGARTLLAETLLRPPGTLALDVTELAPADAAERIVAYAASRAANRGQARSIIRE